MRAARSLCWNAAARIDVNREIGGRNLPEGSRGSASPIAGNDELTSGASGAMPLPQPGAVVYRPKVRTCWRTPKSSARTDDPERV